LGSSPYLFTHQAVSGCRNKYCQASLLNTNPERKYI
jgi:hypothetical protein